MKKVDLMLHCGAHKVDRADVCNVVTPAPTKTWTPIPHITLIELVEETLKAQGLSVIQCAHSLTNDGARYFGLMQVVREEVKVNLDYTWVLGARNSHDKRFPAGLVAGADVFICDNLSFSGEIRFARKHTVFIMRDLPALTARAVGKLMDKWHTQDQRIEAYKGFDLLPEAAHDLVVRALDSRVMTTTQLPRVLKEYREPQHEEFLPRTVWSLFNAFTQVMKEVSLPELPARTERLHGLLDNAVGLH